MDEVPPSWLALPYLYHAAGCSAAPAVQCLLGRQPLDVARRTHCMRGEICSAGTDTDSYSRTDKSQLSPWEADPIPVVWPATGTILQTPLRSPGWATLGRSLPAMGTVLPGPPREAYRIKGRVYLGPLLVTHDSCLPSEGRVIVDPRRTCEVLAHTCNCDQMRHEFWDMVPGSICPRCYNRWRSTVATSGNPSPASPNVRDPSLTPIPRAWLLARILAASPPSLQICGAESGLRASVALVEALLPCKSPLGVRGHLGQ